MDDIEYNEQQILNSEFFFTGITLLFVASMQSINSRFLYMIYKKNIYTAFFKKSSY